MGDRHRVEQCYLAALEKNEKYANALNGMGGVLLFRYKESGDDRLLKRSVAFFQQAIDVDPSFYGARANLQHTLSLMQQAEKNKNLAAPSASDDSTTTRSSAQRKLSMTDHLVYKLDEIRSITGSFVCYSKDDSYLSALSESILSTPAGAEMRGFIERLNFSPTDDLIFRSNLIGVREEPRMMMPCCYVLRNSRDIVP
ncbi:MAG: hypothetical protein BECKG1743D_GA0114223_106772 [Candidatus Kentron sp. G]|nr:MAG: hypothetical protein BECKG1743E_GA0114224_102522 [Candidatus Kentron sp. G]VFN05140.1 MAG: hypothetical protein BECKG1743D_GA0114223_106772 [Candidatus Kentron sp. G]